MQKHKREGLQSFLELWLGARNTCARWLAVCGNCITGPIFVGVKMVGDMFVPAGEESTRLNTTDGTVRDNKFIVELHSCVIIVISRQKSVVLNQTNTNML